MDSSEHLSLLLLSSDPTLTSDLRAYMRSQQGGFPLFVAADPDEALRKTLPSIHCDAVLLDFADGPDERLVRFVKVLRQHYATLPLIAIIEHPETAKVAAILGHGIGEWISRDNAASPELTRILAFAKARTDCLANDATEHQFLTALLETYPDLIYFKDREGVFLRTSQSLAENVGALNRDDMIGRTDFDYFDEAHARKAFHDESRVMHTRDQMIGEREPVEFPNLGRQWVSTTRVPLVNSADVVIGTMGISRIITDVVEAENALQQERLYLRTVIDAMDDAVYVKDAKGRFLIGNPACALLHGLTQSSALVGHTSEALLEGEPGKAWHNRDLAAILAQKAKFDQPFAFLSPKGTAVDLRTTQIPFRNPANGEIGLVGICRSTHSPNPS